MSNSALSPNFVFLKRHEPQLVRLGTLAERYFKDDPCTCLIKLRQFGELLAQLPAANAGLYRDDREFQLDLLRRLRDRGIVGSEVYEVFNEIRVVGNRATHDMVGTHRTALDTLKFARKLGIWFHRTFGDRNFRPGPFVPPPDPVQESETMRQEMERLRADVQRYQDEVSPKVAVTVDLLTTGIDVPAICNLVFIRRVKSRILYAQMLGRATRRCDDIGKEIFQIFDAVNLYETLAAVSDMKPVVANPKISFTQLMDELETVSEPQAVTEILDQITAKLQRKRRHLSDTSPDTLEVLAGMPVDEVVQHLRQRSPGEAATWLKQRREIAEILDRRAGGSQPVLVSYHADELRRVERGYGVFESGEAYGRPEDYLDSFKRFIETNLNQMPALLVVTQRPRDLTRAQLKELRAALDAAGYSEATLRSAWRDATNQDIAASIIGYIRQTALGDALVPYEDRVDRALKKILESQRWTAPQRKWLERIGQQLKQETVVDKAALDRGQFKTQGGFNRINRVFEGRLEQVLNDLNNQIWQGVS